jgi:uncharacterized protein (DUF305 family)
MGITWRLATLFIFLCALEMQAPQHGSRPHLGDRLAIDPNWSELNSSMEKMHRAMASVEASGDGDVDFVRLMLPHHQAAIDMAKTQLMYGKDPQMRRLAQEIITDQQSEIELMQLWLKQRAALSANPGHASDIY